MLRPILTSLTPSDSTLFPRHQHYPTTSVVSHRGTTTLGLLPFPMTLLNHLRVPEAASLPISPPAIPTIDHKIFAVYHRESAATLIPDSGATHILIRETDADIFQSTTPYPPHTRRPQFEVANRQFISPIATGVLRFPESTVTTQAYVFRDTDLADNLFGIAPLLHQGYTATFTDSAFTMSGNKLRTFRNIPQHL
jgi:hypothetical protein